MTYDIIFCALPPLALDRIYSAPPLLKSVVQNEGYQARCFDFALDLFNLCNRDVATYSRMCGLLMLSEPSLSDQEQVIFDQYIQHVVNTISSTDTRYIGISVFSLMTHRSVTIILNHLHALGLSDRVVLGGRGVTARSTTIIDNLIPAGANDYKTDYADIVINLGLAKHVIRGDGEDAVLDFLKNNQIAPTHHVINGMKSYWPDYSDYDFTQYLWKDGKIRLTVTGSHGCVRDCDFCDIGRQFKKYQYKTGQAIFEELKYFQKNYNVNDFIFTDSLINGSMKHFKQFVELLADHNRNSTNKISWSSQYISRDELMRLQDPDEFYKNLADSGAQGLTIGAETLSNRVLKSMNKKSTTDALFFELEYFRKYNITCFLLTFCGHWAETHTEFVEHCQNLVRLIPYIKSGTVSSLYLGLTYSILPDTPSWYNLDIIKNGKHMDMWIHRNNRTNTYKIRMQRRLILSQLWSRLNNPAGQGGDEAYNVSDEFIGQAHEFINYNIDEINAFFEKHADKNKSDWINDEDAFIDSILNYKKTIDITLTLESSLDPEVAISLGNRMIHQGLLKTGEHTFNYSANVNELEKINRLHITLLGKTSNDTVVDCEGNIVQDKFVKIKYLSIDNCVLSNDVEFMYTQWSYLSNGTKTTGKPGLWDNQTLELQFELPFVGWYCNLSDAHRSNNTIETLDKTARYGNLLIEQVKSLKY